MALGLLTKWCVDRVRVHSAHFILSVFLEGASAIGKHRLNITESMANCLTTELFFAFLNLYLNSGSGEESETEKNQNART